MRNLAVAAVLTGSLAAIASIGALGCKSAAEQEAERRARDKATLDSIVLLDRALDATLKQADEIAMKGDELKAAELLDRQAIPNADAALQAATAAQVETPWGHERQDELRALLTDRRAEIPRYAGALRSTDLESKLGAVQKQVELEKRTIDVVAKVATN
jgi:hypothetical protein